MPRGDHAWKCCILFSRVLSLEPRCFLPKGELAGRKGETGFPIGMRQVASGASPTNLGDESDVATVGYLYEVRTHSFHLAQNGSSILKGWTDR